MCSGVEADCGCGLDGGEVSCDVFHQFLFILHSAVRFTSKTSLVEDLKIKHVFIRCCDEELLQQKSPENQTIDQMRDKVPAALQVERRRPHSLLMREEEKQHEHQLICIQGSPRTTMFSLSHPNTRIQPLMISCSLLPTHSVQDYVIHIYIYMSSHSDYTCTLQRP